MPLGLADLTLLKGGLLVSPEHFIRRYVLYTPGNDAPAASGVVTIHMYEATKHEEKTRPGSVLGVLSRPFHSTDAISLSYSDPNSAPAGVTLSRTVPSLRVLAHWVVTSFHPPGAAAPFPWYTLSAASGLMVTQRLTGCAFVVQSAGGSTRVAHVMPESSPPETGAQLRARLQALLGAGVTIYGRGEYSEDREVTIAGIDNGHGWHIYAQKHDLLSFKVRSVRQIFP